MAGDLVLSEQQKSFVERQIAEGHYSSAQEVMGEALRLLEVKEERLAELDALLEEGCRDIGEGAEHDADAVFDELSNRFRPSGDAVRIARILHSARDYEALLFPNG